jgi:TPR repeat protein
MAQKNLGYMYSRGTGVAQDFKEAAKLYLLAAEQGQPDAQFLLGAMYALGGGLPGDTVQAYAWYNLAGANGQADATSEKETLGKEMTPEQINRAQDLSQALYEKIHGN